MGLVLVWVMGAVGWRAPATEGFIYYNRIISLTNAATLRRVKSDGTDDQAIGINLPAAAFPTASRDGRKVLVTSPDPGRPFKISNNIFVQDVGTGTVGRLTSYEDTIISQGVIYTNDLGQVAGNSGISQYTINFPYHKAFSPDGTRVAVVDFRQSGDVTQITPVSQQGATTLGTSSGRSPVIEVFDSRIPVSPVSEIFYGTKRSSVTQGGDGLDWHPTREEIVAAISADIPATGTAMIPFMEGTVLVKFASSGIQPSPLKLTSPVGRWDTFYEGFNLVGTSSAQHDFAPAISPDGTRVAYVRHTLRLDSRVVPAQLPAECAIRVINYDGSGDHEIIFMQKGLWVTKLAWSPDGTQIAFDLAPQLALSDQRFLLGDATKSAIQLVNADGSNPRQIVPAPASFPTWAPPITAAPRPTILAKRAGELVELQIERLLPGREFQVEGSSDLRTWTQLLTVNPAGTNEVLTVTPSAQFPVSFYRIRVP